MQKTWPLTEACSEEHPERAYRRGYHQGYHRCMQNFIEGKTEVQAEKFCNRLFTWRLKAIKAKNPKAEYPPVLT